MNSISWEVRKPRSGVSRQSPLSSTSSLQNLDSPNILLKNIDFPNSDEKAVRVQDDDVIEVKTGLSNVDEENISTISTY